MSTLFEFHEMVEVLDRNHFNADEERSWRRLGPERSGSLFQGFRR